MIVCPYCDHENIEGADNCEQCQQPLGDLHLPSPASGVERRLLKDRISVLHPRPANPISPDMPIGEVLQMMVDLGHGCVVVVDGERLVGIFSERDALTRLSVDYAKLLDRPVSEFMTPNPKTLRDSAKIAFAVQRMDQGGYRHIPIVDAEGRATGIISVRDIFRYLTGLLSPSAV